jgi:hypothetical protein
MPRPDDNPMRRLAALIEDNPLRRLAALIERLGKAVNDGREDK